MDWDQRIQDVQKHLVEEKIDGWLLYDFHGSNSLAKDFLLLSKELLVTRRFFYWIPVQGDPIKIVHAIEKHVLHHLPGHEIVYLKWQELEAALQRVLGKQSSLKIAMEYSPRNAIPYVSKVDGGTIDLVRSSGAEVVSSAGFLQHYTCILDQEQMEMHLAAAQFLDRTAAKAWDKIRESLVRGEKINEYQVRQFIAQEIDAHGFTTEALPICAVNAHSADPHFEPLKVGSAEIKRGDLILIDLWCKKKHPKAIYGDITRMGIADSAPKEKEKQVFDIVRKAQKAAMHLVEQRYSQGKQLTGYEVDATCRKVIEESGYGAYFTHRTGHNIYTEDHGPGAHIDSLETLDKRPLLPHTCFSIEPGIYLPNEFGVRLEHDVYLGDQGKALVTGGSQDAFTLLF